MYISYILIIIILAIADTLPLNSTKCNRLPNGCVLKSYYCNQKYSESTCYFYVCDKIDLKFKKSESELLLQNCISQPKVQEALNNIYFRLSKSSILDASFDLLNTNIFLNIEPYGFRNLNEALEMATNWVNRVKFRNIKGFDTFEFDNKTLRIEFFDSKLDLYSNGSKSCGDLRLQNYSSYEGGQNDVRFHRSTYKDLICPFFLFYLKVDRLRFYGIQNTFYKSNFPRFSPISKNSTSFHIQYLSPYLLDFIDMQNIELNSIILDKTVFNSINILRLFGDIKSIQPGLLKSFDVLKYIHIDSQSIRKLVHHQGIEWMLDLNAENEVNLTNLSINDRINCVAMLFYTYDDHGTTISFNFNFNDVFPDEDFCLYTNYPFHRMVVTIADFFREDFSCTFAWIIQYHLIFNEVCHDPVISKLMLLIQLGNIEQKIATCNFNQR